MNRMRENVHKDFIKNQATIMSATEHQCTHCRNHLQGGDPSCHALLFTCISWHEPVDKTKI